jgi:tRNA threonylcarbamoyladenosine biosynthesis protein TsaE
VTDPVVTVRTTSAQETRDVAAVVAGYVQPDDLLVLAGDLGAGKTCFVQGLAAALDVTDPVTSPTFTLANVYKGRLEINHLDVYRFQHIEEAMDLGLAELLDSGSVTLVEWGDTILPALPPEHLELRFLLGAGDDDRSIEVRLHGARWQVRGRVLREALASWAGER